MKILNTYNYKNKLRLPNFIKKYFFMYCYEYLYTIDT